MTLLDESSTVSQSDRDALREAVASFAAARSPEASVRAAIATDLGYDAALWTQLAEQLGLPGLLVEESYGGSGSSFEEVAIVLEELGRALVPSPLLSVYLATAALAGSEAGPAYLPELASGTLLAALALPQPGGGERPLPEVTAVAPGVLAGSAGLVIDGHLEGLLIVAARDADDLALYLVAPDAPGVTRTPLPGTDLTRRCARIDFDLVPATRIGGREAIDQLYLLAAVGLACEQAGGAAAVLTSSVAYAQVRSQFGRAIGSFQSIKHHCAEMLQAVESGRATATRAAKAIADEDPEAVILGAIAKAWCSEAYARGAATNLHIHGGIGYTWEHSAHLHLRRAMSDQLLFGDAHHHRLVLSELLGL